MTATPDNSCRTGEPLNGSGRRDRRLDFFRGLALLMIFNLHLIGNRFAAVSMESIFYCSGIEVFIFISGYLAGRVYQRTHTRDGWSGILRKIVCRCAELNVAHLVMLITCILLVDIWRGFAPINTALFNMEVLDHEPHRAMRYALVLAYTPWLMDILKLYIIFLAVLPAMFWLYRLHRGVGIGVSLGLYGVTLLWPIETALTQRPTGELWAWNPLAWQALFFLPMIIGMEQARNPRQLPRSLVAVAFAIAAVVGCLILRATVELPHGWTDRLRMGPMRVINLIPLAYLAATCLPPGGRAWALWPVRPIVRCGEYPLWTFAAGVILTYIGSLTLLTVPPSIWIDGVVAGTGLGLLMALPWVRSMFPR